MSKFIFAILIIIAAPATANVGTTKSVAVRDPVMESVVRDLCNKDVALLGEADHGDGRTVEFKAKLVELLVRRCHFNAVFFEASHYDFLAFTRKLRLRQPTSPNMISSSIGGIWNRNEELRQLIPFFYAEAKAGRVRLAGLDDQLGSAGAFYSLGDMPPELAASLEGERRTECSDALRRRINYDFESEYTPAYRSKIVQCVADMSTAISKDSTADRTTRDERLQMVANVERALARDFSDQASLIAGRDQSMYLNFRWLAGRLPPRSKIIVWGATAHMAKDANALPEYSNAPNLGFLVHRDYGRRAFVLAFSAASGAHYWSRKEPSRQIEKAAPNSLEAAALAPSANHATYLGPAALMRLGKREGGALSFHKPLSVSWSDVIDGLVVFPEERPPQRLDSALSYP